MNIRKILRRAADAIGFASVVLQLVWWRTKAVIRTYALSAAALVLTVGAVWMVLTGAICVVGLVSGVQEAPGEMNWLTFAVCFPPILMIGNGTLALVGLIGQSGQKRVSATRFSPYGY